MKAVRWEDTKRQIRELDPDWDSADRVAARERSREELRAEQRGYQLAQLRKNSWAPQAATVGRHMHGGLSRYGAHGSPSGGLSGDDGGRGSADGQERGPAGSGGGGAAGVAGGTLRTAIAIATTQPTRVHPRNRLITKTGSAFGACRR